MHEPYLGKSVLNFLGVSFLVPKYGCKHEKQAVLGPEDKLGVNIAK